MTEPAPRLDLEPHRAFLWGLLYRMMGTAADAEDLVQETFVRALERPPVDLSRPLGPWLTRVAMNLARDQLRKRRRRGYPGTWLPTPVETDESALRDGAALGIESHPEARYGALESASYAFLLAVEALTPSQRAVLLMRDVLDQTVRETAEALDMTESNVKTTHHRARKAMSAYDARRAPDRPASGSAAEAMLFRLMAAFSSGSLDEAKTLLREDVRALSDGGGVAFAAKKPVVGREKVSAMYGKLSTFSSSEMKASVRNINGEPAFVVEDPEAKPPMARRFVVRVELDEAGLVRELHSILAPAKLAGIRAVD